jgi:hypothetical protein
MPTPTCPHGNRECDCPACAEDLEDRERWEIGDDADSEALA